MPMAITRDDYDAVLLDLDGVITDTANLHAACWKQMFDEYLQKRVAERGEPFHPFELATDYRLYVDGKPRFDGVRDFLTSRGIHLPEGSPDDAPEAETVGGLGNRKNDEKLKIIPQDDDFLDREPWDFRNTPSDHYPLLLFYHPLNIYRRQVIKQADVVLAMFLLGNAFSPEAKQRNFEFYDPLTTGDSSLSSCIEAIIAAQIGDLDKAFRYGMAALLMDLADVGGNVKDGCHIASMGGTWMMLTYGFGGMRDDDGTLSFWPRRAPEENAILRFPLTYRAQMLEVEIGPETVQYSLREGERLVIHHEKEEIQLTRENPLAVRPVSRR